MKHDHDPIDGDGYRYLAFLLGNGGVVDPDSGSILGGVADFDEDIETQAHEAREASLGVADDMIARMRGESKPVARSGDSLTDMLEAEAFTFTAEVDGADLVELISAMNHSITTGCPNCTMGLVWFFNGLLAEWWSDAVETAMNPED